MRSHRIHIMGASGCGVSTLGRDLADRLALPSHDTDDYYWLPTTPPYTRKREIADRLRLVREVFLDRDGWILSGSLDGWGEQLVAYFDLVVFLRAPTEVRLARLREREARHFGREAVAPGGWRHQDCEVFIEWASHYDDGTVVGRSLPRHEAWLATLPCPVLRLDATRPRAELVESVVAALEAGRRSG